MLKILLLLGNITYNKIRYFLALLKKYALQIATDTIRCLYIQLMLINKFVNQHFFVYGVALFFGAPMVRVWLSYEEV